MRTELYRTKYLFSDSFKPIAMKTKKKYPLNVPHKTNGVNSVRFYASKEYFQCFFFSSFSSFLTPAAKSKLNVSYPWNLYFLDFQTQFTVIHLT